MQNDKISIYGFKFQAKLISCLMTDVTFIGQIYDILKLDYFESEAIQYIVKASLKYYIEYKKAPTLDVFKVDIEKLNDDLLKQEIIRVLKESVIEASASDLDFIKQSTIDFCKNQEIKNAILKSVDLLPRGKYDEIKTLIDSALKIGTNLNIGLDYSTTILDRYNETAREPVATGWDILNEITKGGLAPGELGIILGGTGSGKSWFLAHIGANAIKLNRDVIHYTLELDEKYTARRYDSILTGISLDKISMYTDKVIEELQDIPGKLTITYFPEKSISINGLRAHLTKLKMLNMLPKLVLVDYPDLLRFSDKLAKHDALELLYQELRGMAGEFQLPIWAVSQVNRSAHDNNIVEADSTAGSYAKLFTADLVLSLSRKAADKISNTARVHVVKNRLGPDGMTFPTRMDTNCGIIELEHEYTDKGKSVQKSMKTDAEYDRAILKQRYNQLMSPQTSDKKDYF